MDKQVTFLGSGEAGIFCQGLFNSNGSLEKRASAPAFADWETGDEIRKYISGITAADKKKYCYVLVNALGAGEYFGSNINADHFPWNALCHEGDDYGYKTFLSAHAFQHHKNKDPTRAFGIPVLSVLNHTMKRVELIIRLDREKAKLEGADGIITRIDAGEFPDVSMGCKVPYDVCSKCGNKSKTRDDYCVHMKPPEELRHVYGPNKILPDGSKIFVYNLHPRFFDISFVFIGADKTAKVMAKLASVGGMTCLGDVCALPRPSAEIYELTRGGIYVPEGTEKTATSWKRKSEADLARQGRSDQRFRNSTRADYAAGVQGRNGPWGDWDKKRDALYVAHGESKNVRVANRAKSDARRAAEAVEAAASAARKSSNRRLLIGGVAGAGILGAGALAHHLITSRKQGKKLTKTASADCSCDCEDECSGDKLAEAFIKAAEAESLLERIAPHRDHFGFKRPKKKMAEIIKEVPTGIFSMKRLPALESQEDDLSDEAMEEFASCPVPSSLGALGAMGIVMKPHEYGGMVLRRMGEDGLADLMGSHTLPHVHEFGDSDVDMGDGALDVLGTIFQVLGPYLKTLVQRRSGFSEPLSVRMSIRHVKIPLPTRQPIAHPLLGKISAAYNGYRRDLLTKLSQATEVVQSDPRLREMILGEGLVGMFSKQAHISQVVSIDSLSYMMGAHLHDRSLLSNTAVAVCDDGLLKQELLAQRY